jgi:hypothetical protein
VYNGWNKAHGVENAEGTTIIAEETM